MSDLIPLGESVVEASEIDALGHLNVRNYIYRGHAANLELMTRAGLDAEATNQIDLYSRFLKEQYAGARLRTLGGFIESEGGADLNAYFEIRNAESGDLAATLIIGSDPGEDGDDLGAENIDVDHLRIRLPEHGKPRSLSLVRPREIPFADVEAKVRDRRPEPGRPGGRMEVSVHADDCDERDILRREIDLMLMIYDRSGPREDGQVGPAELQDAHGQPYGWAMMEARTFTFRRPRAGDRLTSLGGDISYTDKVRLSRRWIFDGNSGDPVGIHDAISLCIDLEARRSRAIPTEIMEMIQEDCLAEFA